jgi:hypothetical protein
MRPASAPATGGGPLPALPPRRGLRPPAQGGPGNRPGVPGSGPPQGSVQARHAGEASAVLVRIHQQAGPLLAEGLLVGKRSLPSHLSRLDGMSNAAAGQPGRPGAPPPAACTPHAAQRRQRLGGDSVPDQISPIMRRPALLSSSRSATQARDLQCHRRCQSGRPRRPRSRSRSAACGKVCSRSSPFFASRAVARVGALEILPIFSSCKLRREPHAPATRTKGGRPPSPLDPTPADLRRARRMRCYEAIP